MFLLERIECNTYNVLDSASRNEKYREESFCDDLYYPFDSEWNALSPQWRGSSWYRFLPPAGTKLSQTPPGRGHCATYSTGWTNSSLPVRAGDIADITLCFDLSKNNGVEYDCENMSMGKVSNCGDYFVYYLPNVPNCVSRYCATD